MKCRFTFLPMAAWLLALCLPPTSAHAQRPTPAFSAVYQQFHQRYQWRPTEDRQLHFAKMPDGWHMQQLDASTLAVEDDDLFWSRDASDYVTVRGLRPARQSPRERLLGQEWSLDGWVQWYDWLPYYGYTGWDSDVIDALLKTPDLTDTLWHALGKAYSSYAENLLGHGPHFEDPRLLMPLGAGRQALNPAQAKEYRHYRQQAVAAYDSASRLNPYLETPEGNIALVKAHACMAGYRDLLWYMGEQEAAQALPSQVYDTVTRTHAHNLLFALPKDAILLTQHPNNTYPLWYMQAAKGLRPDVTVVNVNDLALDRGLFYALEYASGARRLPTTLSAAEHAALGEYLVQFSPAPYRLMPGELWTTLRQWLAAKEQAKPNEQVVPPGLPGNRVAIPFATGRSTPLSLKPRNTLVDQSDMVVLDLLSTNERPVYALAGQTYSTWPFSTIGQWEGPCTRLGVRYPGAPQANTQKTAAWFGQRSPLPLAKPLRPYHLELVAQERRITLQLAKQYIQGMQAQKAIALLNKALKETPYSTAALGVYTDDFVGLYLQAGDWHGADALLGHFMDQGRQKQLPLKDWEAMARDILTMIDKATLETPEGWKQHWVTVITQQDAAQMP